jgi:hypothetical protein
MHGAHENEHLSLHSFFSPFYFGDLDNKPLGTAFRYYAVSPSQDIKQPDRCVSLFTTAAHLPLKARLTQPPATL